VKLLRLILRLTFFPAAFAFLGGAAAADAHARVEVGLVAGALAGPGAAPDRGAACGCDFIAP
jgi:hypothetical protein